MGTAPYQGSLFPSAEAAPVTIEAAPVKNVQKLAYIVKHHVPLTMDESDPSGTVVKEEMFPPGKTAELQATLEEGDMIEFIGKFD